MSALKKKIAKFADKRLPTFLCRHLGHKRLEEVWITRWNFVNNVQTYVIRKRIICARCGEELVPETHTRPMRLREIVQEYLIEKTPEERRLEENVYDNPLRGDYRAMFNRHFDYFHHR